MLIKFGNISTHLVTRFAGASVRQKIASALHRSEEIIFDFSGVESVSNSFADECFAKLILSFDSEEIKSKSTFQNTSPFIKAVIANAFKERLAQQQSQVAEIL